MKRRLQVSWKTLIAAAGLAAVDALGRGRRKLGSTPR